MFLGQEKKTGDCFFGGLIFFFLVGFQIEVGIGGSSGEDLCKFFSAQDEVGSIDPGISDLNLDVIPWRFYLWKLLSKSMPTSHDRCEVVVASCVCDP